MLDCCASQKKHTDRRQTNGRLSENEHVNDREKAKSSMLFQYLMDSSVHGMRYLCEPRRHWSERIFWLFSIILSACVCSSLIIDVYEKLQNSPIIVSFGEREAEVEDIPFPAVTICAETKVSSFIMNFTKVFQAILTNESDLTNDEISRMAAISHICLPEIVTYLDLPNSTVNTSIIDMIETSALPKNMIFQTCKWRNLDRNCDEYFKKVLTEEGVCFTFNALDSTEIYTDEVSADLIRVRHNLTTKYWSLETGYDKNAPDDNEQYPFHTYDAGPISGLDILLILLEQDLEYICRGPYTGFKLMLHLPVETPPVSRKSLSVPLNQQMKIAIKPNVIKTSNTLRKYNSSVRQCFFTSERKLRFFRVYTQLNCESECFANFTKTYCGCVKFSMPRDNETRVCGHHEIKCYDEAQVAFLRKDFKGGLRNVTRPRKKCNCLPSCTSITYEMETSQGKYNINGLTKAFGFDATSLRPAAISVFFNEHQFIITKRSELYGSTDFFAYCGGVLGLCLGVSLLSIVEIFYYFTLRLYFSLRHREVSDKD